MTQALTAILDGTKFQARLFWEKAARLLMEDSPIVKVGFEKGPKSFDDIWVEYAPGRAPADQFGNPLRREHLQCKWHTQQGEFGYVDLIDRQFVNAKARSLLERAHMAQVKHAPDGIGVRFKLVTNWRIAQSDPLRPLVSTRSGQIDPGKLFATKTDKSSVGEVRKAWREHLGIDEPALRMLAGTLAFGQVPESLDELRDKLDVTFRAVGLRRVPANESSFLYDELVYEWMAQKRVEFDRKSFRAACDQQELLRPSVPSPKVYGVKSFEHAHDRLEDRCERVLDLVPAFDQRYIRDDDAWSSELYPKLRTFLHAAVLNQERLRLALDAHTTLAFISGAILDIKANRLVELEQRTMTKAGKPIWSPDDQPFDPDWPVLRADVIEIDPSKPELAIAAGITHDVGPAVRDYVGRTLPNVGKILHCLPSSGANARSVVCGHHALIMVDELMRKIAELRSGGARPLNHLFIAAPNAFTFFLGQRHSFLGQSRLYEFDFEGGRAGSYFPSLTLPVTVGESKATERQ